MSNRLFSRKVVVVKLDATMFCNCSRPFCVKFSKIRLNTSHGAVNRSSSMLARQNVVAVTGLGLLADFGSMCSTHTTLMICATVLCEKI